MQCWSNSSITTEVALREISDTGTRYKINALKTFLFTPNDLQNQENTTAKLGIYESNINL